MVGRCVRCVSVETQAGSLKSDMTVSALRSAVPLVLCSAVHCEGRHEALNTLSAVRRGGVTLCVLRVFPVVCGDWDMVDES